MSSSPPSSSCTSRWRTRGTPASASASPPWACPPISTGGAREGEGRTSHDGSGSLSSGREGGGGGRRRLGDRGGGGPGGGPSGSARLLLRRGRDEGPRG